MPRFSLKESHRQQTSCAGLSLIGQCCEVAQVDQILGAAMPVATGRMTTADLFKSLTALISLGKNDFEAIEPFRKDRFFREALSIGKVPSSAWLRQQLDAQGAKLREHTDEASLRLLKLGKAPITAHKGYVCLDFDTFAMDNSNSRKEEVSRTYQGFDGYTPIAAYLGNEGWSIGLELRPGKQHSALETDYFLERVFPRVARLVPAASPVLVRSDSGFDSACLLFAHAQERDRMASLGRGFEYLIKWNPRGQAAAKKKPTWVARAEAANAFREVRPGKREALLNLDVERAWKKEHRRFRLIVRVVERTIDKKGKRLPEPEVEIEGWWTSLVEAPEMVIERYQDHGTHEQFHSEIKTDLDLERLPSGKFDTNDAVLHVAMFAYNCLRLIGQLGLIGELSSVRHPAMRRRLKTVLQEVMYRGAQFITRARYLFLDFGACAGHIVPVFAHVQARLLAARSP
ncbi:MAG: IS1380 family transposase [Candidatus Accumulibacter sp. UW20]|jgi:hypothetical protein